jgi:cytoskeletal protein CcmA (bactofilin family)
MIQVPPTLAFAVYLRTPFAWAQSSVTVRSEGIPLTDPSYIGPTLKIEGEIIADEDLHIDGCVEGSLSVGGHRITVGEMAFLIADTIAREVVVHGAVQGNLRASDRVEIKKHACVEGDMAAAQVVVEEGAHFKGRVDADGSALIGADLCTLLARAETRAAQESAKTDWSATR